MFGCSPLFSLFPGAKIKWKSFERHPREILLNSRRSVLFFLPHVGFPLFSWQQVPVVVFLRPGVGGDVIFTKPSYSRCFRSFAALKLHPREHPFCFFCFPTFFSFFFFGSGSLQRGTWRSGAWRSRRRCWRSKTSAGSGTTASGGARFRRSGSGDDGSWPGKSNGTRSCKSGSRKPQKSSPLLLFVVALFLFLSLGLCTDLFA